MDSITQRMDDYIRSHQDEIIGELSAFCAQPSISAQGVGMAETLEMVVGFCRKRGLQVEVLPSPAYPAVLAEAKGASPRTLLFYNHYDVQPPDPLNEWVTPPFEPTVRDGRIYARGVMDDKGHIISRLAAVDAALAVLGELPCGVKFFIEGEEEISSPNLPNLIKTHANRLQADACLWEFGDVDQAGVSVHFCGLRGIVYVELTLQTAKMDSHSGVTGGIFPNPAWRLLWAITSLKDHDERILIPGFYDHVKPVTARDLDYLKRLPEQGDVFKETYGVREFIKGVQGGVDLQREAAFTPTCNICGITTGYQGKGQKAIVPARASAKLDFRLVPDQDPEDILHKLRAYLDAQGFKDIEMTVFGREAPGRTDPDHPFVRLVAESAAEVYGQPGRVVPMSGGSGPFHLFTDLGIPVTTIGVGNPASAIHAPNENIRVQDLLDAARHTCRVMARLRELPS